MAESPASIRVLEAVKPVRPRSKQRNGPYWQAATTSSLPTHWEAELVAAAAPLQQGRAAYTEGGWR